jgi:phage-related protein
MKPLFFVGTSQEDLRKFPADVKDAMGYALFEAQNGGKHRNAKPLKGFGGASVLEIVDDFDGDTYRAIYTVKFADAIYALHAFQKKSKKGIQTPKQDIELIKNRLKEAQQFHKIWQEGGKHE